MTNQEIYEKILNKKFNKSVFTGYDTADVDQFFDFVIEYLKNNEKNVAVFRKNAEDLKKQNELANEEIAKKDAKINELLMIIKQYEDDGYGNVSHNKRLQEQLNKKGAK